MKALRRSERPGEGLQVGLLTSVGSTLRTASDSEPLATLGAAARKHGASGTSGHARAEAMSTGAVNLARLVSALHDSESLGAKTALKQAHGGSKEGRQGYAADLPVSSSAVSGRESLGSRRGDSRPVDNPRRMGIDSPPARVDRRGKNSFSILLLSTTRESGGAKPCRVRYGIAV